MGSLDNRIRKLESDHEDVDVEIIKKIMKGTSYDKLTDEEKYQYCRYHGFDRDAFEEVNRTVLGTTDVTLELKPPPMSPDEERQHINKVIKEVEELVMKAEDDLREEMRFQESS